VPFVLLGLSLLVLVHEGGHLVAARRTGMVATEFFAGFGPVVVAWRTPSGLRVGLKAIPAGGYVKLVGMTGRERVDPLLEAGTFRAASRRRRLVVVAAGPLVNLLLGVVLFVAASAADPLPGQSGGPFGALGQAWRSTSLVATTTVTGVGDIVADLDGYAVTLGDPAARADEAPARFLSPVGLAQITDEVIDLGPWTVVRLVAIVSIGLGVMNLLPLPPLDGGHAALVVVEWVGSVVLRRPALRLDAASPGIVAVTVATLVLVLGLGLSALILDVSSPVTL
jgi:membrane-associated protease RseP (regulator of RpoE activity)